MLSEFGVYLKSSAYSMNVKPLLKQACSRIFGSAAGIVDMLTRHVPSSKKATASKVRTTYTGEHRCRLQILWSFCL